MLSQLNIFKMMAVPIPPMQSEASPYCLLLRFISYMRLTVILLPEAPMGCQGNGSAIEVCNAFEPYRELRRGRCKVA